MIEVELKFLVSHLDVLGKLNECGANFIGEETNVDTYFNHPCRDFVVSDEAIRIRNIDGKKLVTYKGKKYSDQSKSREELETTISSSEVFEEILLRLGFVPSGDVKKRRSKWKYSNVLITLDDVKDLGEYVEMEIQIDQEEKLNETITHIKAVAKELGINPDEQILTSYLNLLQMQNPN